MFRLRSMCHLVLAEHLIGQQLYLMFVGRRVAPDRRVRGDVRKGKIRFDEVRLQVKMYGCSQLADPHPP